MKCIITWKFKSLIINIISLLVTIDIFRLPKSSTNIDIGESGKGWSETVPLTSKAQPGKNFPLSHGNTNIPLARCISRFGPDSSKNSFAVLVDVDVFIVDAVKKCNRGCVFCTNSLHQALKQEMKRLFHKYATNRSRRGAVRASNVASAVDQIS